MARMNGGGSAPFLVSGGGIGGLITAYALAHQGLPVRVLNNLRIPRGRCRHPARSEHFPRAGEDRPQAMQFLPTPIVLPRRRCATP